MLLKESWNTTRGYSLKMEQDTAKLSSNQARALYRSTSRLRDRDFSLEMLLGDPHGEPW